MVRKVRVRFPSCKDARGVFTESVDPETGCTSEEMSDHRMPSYLKNGQRFDGKFSSITNVSDKRRIA